MVLDDAVKAVLARHRIAHLATADAGGQPHVVPICFVFAEGMLYSVIDRKPKRARPEHLRRVRNLRENPRVAVVMDTYAEDWSRLGYVLVEGTARLIKAGPEHATALRLLREKYPQYRPMQLDDRPVIAIAILRTVRWGRP